MTTLESFSAKSDSAVPSDRRTQLRVRLRIPKEYQREPIISNLITRYGLKVNITAALLGANGQEDGWFDLELDGTQAQIQSALIDLNDLDLEIWCGDDEVW
ncbi:MAG: NIL domain-containing protein [Drouetiella hepatica Uher 2000/2452]|jgi:ABC-type methionine transport system ATPase subunit|uniref:NIL domain-containing protein n=1 Tax=Drouetiella hepatica Uher 2000/2452 TaxID=904376 RepID=A0A951UPV8_9CYAN|nr:NIL domain-containing protein [Drouetiella hepatica Uher 2000/2452]